ncbi:translocation/assembly module TamB domain-containing protein [Terriglobus sp.]|uniref:translocation/assembly module TamB domain-containing protein n=1 Tax=Terriglobus sp. TaxID=1889013 RepID=UPI003B0020A5
MPPLNPDPAPDQNPSPKPKPEAKRHHRVLRVVAWLVGTVFVLLLLIVGGLAIYSNTQDFQNRVRSTLVSTLEESTGGKVDLAAVHFSLWHLAIEADGLVIHGFEGPGQPPYVSADRILVRITLKNLFAHATNSTGAMKYITLALLHVDKPQVHLIINKDGTTNQPVPKHPSTSNEPVLDTLLDLQASKVELANGVVLLNDRAIPFDLLANNLGVNVHYITVTDHYGLSIDMDDLRTRMQQMPVAQSRLHVTGELGRKLIAIQNITFDTGKSSHLDANARIENFDNPVWNVQVKGNLEAPQISVLSGFQGLNGGTLGLDIAGHSCAVTPQVAQQKPSFWQHRHPGANPANTKTLPPSPDCPKGYLVAGGATLHQVGYRDQYVNISDVNGRADVRVTPTELLFNAIALNLPAGGAISGDLRISNWLGEVPPDAPAQSATVVAGQKTANATATIANAKPPATGSPVLAPTQRAHAYLDVKLANISLRTINEITEPRRYTDLGFDTAVNGPVHVEWGGNTNDLPKSVVVQADLRLAPQGVRRRSASQDIPVNGVVKANYRGLDQLVTIDRLEAHTPASNVNVTGSLALDRYVTNLNVQADLRDLSEFDSVLNATGYKANGKQGSAALPVALHGDAHFQGTVKGPLADIDVKGHLQANQLLAHLGSTGDVAIDSVTADAEYSSAGVTVASSTIKRGTAVLQLAGAIQPHRVVRRGVTSYEFDDFAKVDVTTHLNDAQMHDVLDIAGQGKLPVTGVLNVDAHVTGTLGNLNGSGNIALRNGVAYDQPFDAITANATVQGQNITATSLQVRAQGVQVDGNGSYDLKSKRVKAHLQGNDIRLSNLKAVQQAKSPVDGVLTFQADADGTVDVPNLRAHLQLANATYTGKAIGQLVADLHSERDVVYLTANSNLLNTPIQATGQLQLAGDYPMQAHATFSNLDVANALKLTGSTVDATSQISGELNVSGPAKKPYALQGSLVINPLAVRTQGLDFHSAAPVRATLQGGVARLEELHIVGPDTDLTASGSAQVFTADGSPLPPMGGRIDAHANGSVNVAIAHRFNPEIIASGQINLAVTATGTTGKPVLGGKVTFANTNLAYAEVPNGLSNMNGTATFTENRLVVDDLTAYSGGGRIKVGGFFQFRNGLFADLTATATAVRVRYYGVSATANANIHLQGDGNGATLSGNVLITRFGLAQTFDFGSIASSAGDVAPPPDPDSLLNKIGLDVRVQSSPSLDFQNSYARIAGTVDLSLRGTAAVPSVLGKVTLTDGSATFNDTKYQLERGQIYFNNPIRIDPIVDIDATARVENYDVIIGLHGTSKNPKLTYRSEPPLSQSDVFNLLALGRTAEEASINSQQLQQQGQDPTTNALLGGALNATVSNRVNKLFGGAGKVKIDPAYVGSIGTSSARITVEQQLTPKITVTFATSVNASQQQLIAAQYQVSDNVTIVASRDENGVFSIVYKIRQRYH